MDSLIDIVVVLIPGLFIAVAASIVTVRLSLKSFYSQRWWEQKAEAYSTIVEALYNMKIYIEAYRDAIEQGKDFDKESHMDLQLKAAEGRDQVFKAAAIGSFVISEDAANSLSLLRDELRREVPEASLFFELDEHSAIVARHLVQLREIAKKDLGVA